MIALLTAALALATPADEAAIAELERAWHGAADAAWMEAHLAEDFLRPMPSGQIWDRGRQIEHVRRLPAAPPLRVSVEPLRIRIAGESAQAIGEASLIDAEGRILDRNAFVDLYIKVEGRWRLLAAHRSQVRPVDNGAP